jgi:Zn-dependent peptidase ImmA (M78 family)
MRVPWLPKEDIANKALEALTGYQAMVGSPITPPIPVEDMIEQYLGLKLSFENLDQELGEGVLGATYVKSRWICVNETLLGDKREGRLVFTCAHEVGHWVLHRHLVELAERNGSTREGILCRSVNARQPIEWQADYFAACLLMPEEGVKRALTLVCQSERLVLDNVRSCFGGTALCVDPCVENWHFIADAICQAGGFTNVSKEAMNIRLQELGLVINRTGVPMGWRSPAL